MFRFAKEAIDYQVKDKFPEDLKSIVENIYSDIDTGRTKTNKEVIKKYGPSIDKLILDRFNMNVKSDELLPEYFMAAILPFSSTYLLHSQKTVGFSSLSSRPSGVGFVNRFKSILLNREDVHKKIHKKKGWIDNKHARLGGYLSEVPHYLIVNYVMLKTAGLTTDEVVAAILHELGHAFTGLEVHYKLVQTNETVASVMEDINKNRPDKIYSTYKRSFGEQELLEAGLSQDSEVVDFYGPLASKYIKSLNSTNLNSKYDETISESLADNFATRFGLGQHIVTGLRKIHVTYGNQVVGSKKLLYICNFVHLLSTVCLLTVLHPLFGGVIASLLLMVNGTNSEDYTYDLPIERYKRIRFTIVNQLKNNKLPKEFTSSLLEQLEVIDFVINNTYPKLNIWSVVSDIVFPNDRSASYYKGLQQQAEHGLNNVLFEKSAKLRTV